MAREWTGKWLGGRTFKGRGGRTFWALERMVGGDRFSKTLDVNSEEDAKAELALFHRDPHAYTTKSQARSTAAADALVMDADTVDRVAAHLVKEERSPKYVKDVIGYLGTWTEDLGGKDLRAFKLKDLLKILGTHKTARRKRIAALKSFTAYFREIEATLDLRDDPTIALMLPPARPEKASREKGYSVELVEKVYAAIYNWEAERTAPDEYGRSRLRGSNVKELRKGWGDPQGVRDVLALRAKYGMHGTEIDRIAAGKGKLEPVKDHPQIKGTLKFQHKSGRQHVVSVDAQGFAAAMRLGARGGPGSDKYLRTSIAYACAKLGIEPINPSELRHSFATWAGEVGVEVKPKGAGVSLEAVAAVLGHFNPRTTGLFYAGVKVPAMIQVPIRLEHPEDPKPSKAA
jgi:integrase